MGDIFKCVTIVHITMYEEGMCSYGQGNQIMSFCFQYMMNAVIIVKCDIL